MQIFRCTLGFITGFLVMSAGVMISFITIQAVLGPEGIFRPGLWVADSRFITLTMAASVFFVIAGGMACELIANSRRTRINLAAAIFILAFIVAVTREFNADDDQQPPPPRPDGITMTHVHDAYEQGWIKEPKWITYTNAFIGSLGVLIGGRFIMNRRNKRTPRAQD